jgi:hypothetical protein
MSPGWLVGARDAPKGLARLESRSIAAFFLPHKKHDYICQYIRRT